MRVRSFFLKMLYVLWQGGIFKFFWAKSNYMERVKNRLPIAYGYYCLDGICTTEIAKFWSDIVSYSFHYFEFLVLVFTIMGLECMYLGD